MSILTGCNYATVPNPAFGEQYVVLYTFGNKVNRDVTGDWADVLGTISLPANRQLIRRFYEAVKFEETLILACTEDPNSLGRAPVDIDIDIEHGAEQAFRSFVNKLAHVSDTRKGGSTVTAVGVLQEFDSIHFLVGSNERITASQQAQLHAFIQTLFRQLTSYGREAELAQAQAAPALRAVALGEVLRRIVEFNKPRISFYIKGLQAHLSVCIPKLQAFSTGNEVTVPQLEASLTRLADLSRAHLEGALDEELMIQSRLDIIRAIQRAHKRDHLEVMFQQSRESQMNQSREWLDLRHTLARLRAYHVSAETLISSASRWPQLFDDPRVTVLPSSIPASCPLPKPKSMTVDQVIGRMAGSPTEIAARRADADRLHHFKLDERLRKACSTENFRPIVHAEILVHDKVLRHLAENPGVTFWNGWSYIGSSKPTCRLCRYYFEEVSDVSVRESHGNLYSRWRLPEVYDAGGDKRRENLMNKIVAKVRQDAWRTLRSRLPQGTNHDSSSFPGVSPWFNHGADVVSATDLSSIMGDLDLKDDAVSLQSNAGVEQQRTVVQKVNLHDIHDDGEDDGGGVLLYQGRRARSFPTYA